jgi:hypothetical protein
VNCSLAHDFVPMGFHDYVISLWECLTLFSHTLNLMLTCSTDYIMLVCWVVKITSYQFRHTVVPFTFSVHSVSYTLSIVSSLHVCTCSNMNTHRSNSGVWQLLMKFTNFLTLPHRNIMHGQMQCCICRYTKTACTAWNSGPQYITKTNIVYYL